MTFTFRRSLQSISRLMLLSLLMSQVALAAQPCLISKSSEALHCAKEMMTNTDESMPDCDGMSAGNCFLNITQDDNNSPILSTDVPQPNLPVFYTIIENRLPIRFFPNDSLVGLRRITDPPPSILFCSFQV